MAPTALMTAAAERTVLSTAAASTGSRRQQQWQLRAAPRSMGFAQSCELTASCKALVAPSSRNTAPAVSRGPVRVLAQELRTEQKVKVTLGPYKGKAIKATAPRAKVAPEDVEKALSAKLAKTHEFERINFTGSGAKLGHTVRINFEGKYADGPQAGQLVKGTKAAGYELELKTRDDEPWRTIVDEIVKKGMGQEESKTFIVKFPADYKAKPLAGVRAQFTVTVKEIGVKKEIEKDPRPVDQQRAEIEQQMQAAAQRKANDVLDAQIRAALLDSSEADVEKVAASVTWAKFGEKSLQDFKWNVVQEEVGRVEGIAFDRVPAFLREEADVTYTD
eukprot:TRINITY_DN35177_c0_g1_i2.p1 TRINITY_DN35177_c0_g1~~TRINITY_DN35177_c0_g1_i2.p1  ORF type:complete len:371 (-),score=39.31 TRINITY_DN35177_c0_g1_i2:45-1043(-)